MDDVLHAVEDQGAFGTGVEQTLDAQDVVAVALEEHREPDGEHRPVERLVEAQRDRANRVVALDMRVAFVRIRLRRLQPGVYLLRARVLGDRAESDEACSRYIAGDAGDDLRDRIPAS